MNINFGIFKKDSDDLGDFSEIVGKPLFPSYRGDIIRYKIGQFRTYNITFAQLKLWKLSFGKSRFVLPWDKFYDYDKTVYNRNVNQFPLMIIYTECKSDVILALSICKKYNIPFVIRSGGHDLQGWSSTDNVVIDVSLFNKIEIVDKECEMNTCSDNTTCIPFKKLEISSSFKSSMTPEIICEKDKYIEKKHKFVPYVEIGSGVKMGMLLETLSEKNYCTPTGTCGTVSTGLQYGGGIGFLQRKYGLSCDAVLEVGIILADGKYIKANATENSELFKAIKGSGNGNYGVIIDLKLEIHPIHDVILFELYFTMDQLEAVIKRFQEFAPDHRDHNLTAELDLYDKTNLPGPILVTGQYAGKIEVCDQFLIKFSDLNPIKKIWKTSFIEAVKHFSSPNPNFFLSAASFFVPLIFCNSDICIIRRWMDLAKPGDSVEVSPMGGAISDPKKDFAKTSCFAWRDAKMWFYIRGGTKDQSENPLTSEWTYGFFEELSQRFINQITKVPRLYINMKPPLNLINMKKYGEAFYGIGYDKLRAIKTKYDPTGLFNYQLGVKGL